MPARNRTIVEVRFKRRSRLTQTTLFSAAPVRFTRASPPTTKKHQRLPACPPHRRAREGADSGEQDSPSKQGAPSASSSLSSFDNLGNATPREEETKRVTSGTSPIPGRAGRHLVPFATVWKWFQRIYSLRGGPLLAGPLPFPDLVRLVRLIRTFLRDQHGRRTVPACTT